MEGLHLSVYTELLQFSMAIYMYKVCLCNYDVPKQLSCMKHSCCTSNQFCITSYSSYIRVFCQQISCSEPRGQYSHLQASCCPVWALQLLHTCTCVEVKSRVKLT